MHAFATRIFYGQSQLPLRVSLRRMFHNALKNFQSRRFARAQRRPPSCIHLLERRRELSWSRCRTPASRLAGTTRHRALRRCFPSQPCGQTLRVSRRRACAASKPGANPPRWTFLDNCAAALHHQAQVILTREVTAAATSFVLPATANTLGSVNQHLPIPGFASDLMVAHKVWVLISAIRFLHSVPSASLMHASIGTPQESNFRQLRR